MPRPLKYILMKREGLHPNPVLVTVPHQILHLGGDENILVLRFMPTKTGCHFQVLPLALQCQYSDSLAPDLSSQPRIPSSQPAAFRLLVVDTVFGNRTKRSRKEDIV